MMNFQNNYIAFSVFLVTHICTELCQGPGLKGQNAVKTSQLSFPPLALVESANCPSTHETLILSCIELCDSLS